MSSTFKSYLQLTRPANLVTAIADILAGLAIAQYQFLNLSFVFLFLSTVCLYAGGVVLNDYFDLEIDRVERRERPIPSGKVPKNYALVLGLLLLLAGISFAFVFSILSGLIASILTIFILFYDCYAKHSSLLGPLVMGMCRGANLLLGISSVTLMVGEYFWMAYLPIIYIGAITIISRDEVYGGTRGAILLALVMYLAVWGSQIVMGVLLQKDILFVLFVSLHILYALLPLLRAYRNATGRLIQLAVKAGVISIILLNASTAAIFGNFYLAILIVLLLPISILFARFFSVT
jgi:4-hydroxybenzoate polyprenyltransferase